jgi:hypothetical protein
MTLKVFVMGIFWDFLRMYGCRKASWCFCTFCFNTKTPRDFMILSDGQYLLELTLRFYKFEML